MATVKTGITLPEDLLRDITRRSQKAGLSRSRYIANALEAYAVTFDRDTMIRQINQAHESESAADRRTRKALNQQFVKLVKDSW